MLIASVPEPAGTGVNTTFTDPLGNKVQQLPDIFAMILNLILAVGTSLVLIMLALGFIQYILSQGDKQKIDNAQHWLTYAVIGGVGLFFVWAIRTVLEGSIGANTTVFGDNVVL